MTTMHIGGVTESPGETATTLAGYLDFLDDYWSLFEFSEQDMVTPYITSIRVSPMVTIVPTTSGARATRLPST